MLDLFNSKKKKQHYDSKQISWNNNSTKHFSSPLREWDNSIYTFNNNAVKLIPSASKLSISLIKSYFNLFNKKLEMKLRTRRLKRKLRRLSSNKYYISNGGFKHTNNKLTINLYVFNRQKTNYLNIIKKRFLKRLLKKTNTKFIVKSNLLDKLKKTLVDLKNKIYDLKLKKSIFKYVLIDSRKTDVTKKVFKQSLKKKTLKIPKKKH